MMESQDNLLLYRDLDLDEDGVSIAVGCFRLSAYRFYNRSAGERFVKIYDKATPPTAADVPVDTIALGAGQPGGIAIPGQINIALGLGIRCTTGFADNDTGAPGTNDVLGTLFYKR